MVESVSLTWGDISEFIDEDDNCCLRDTYTSDGSYDLSSFYTSSCGGEEESCNVNEVTCPPGKKPNKTTCSCETDCSSAEAQKKCSCGIKLNTIVPFIGDCIQFGGSSNDSNTTVVGPTTAFPLLMGGLSKIMVTVILVFSFLLLIVAGVMMTAGGAQETAAYSQGKQLIGKVVVGIALLGMSGLILKLINPSFFG